MALSIPSTASLAALPGCGRKGDGSAGTAPQASPPAPAAPAAHGATFAVDPGGRTTIDMPGVQERIVADTTASAGSLSIDPHDLGASRGVVRVDLATLTMRTFDDPEKNATQSKHARTWLEVAADGLDAAPNRWAEFAVKSVEGLGATDLASVAPAQDGADDVRTLAATVKGDLLVHGHAVERAVPVALTFRTPRGADPVGPGASVEIKTREPLHVVLKEHEIVPRDPVGKALAWTAQLVSKVAETADVTVDLTARRTE